MKRVNGHVNGHSTKISAGIPLPEMNPVLADAKNKMIPRGLTVTQLIVAEGERERQGKLDQLMQEALRQENLDRLQAVVDEVRAQKDMEVAQLLEELGHAAREKRVAHEGTIASATRKGSPDAVSSLLSAVGAGTGEDATEDDDDEPMKESQDGQGALIGRKMMRDAILAEHPGREGRQLWKDVRRGKRVTIATDHGWFHISRPTRSGRAFLMEMTDPGSAGSAVKSSGTFSRGPTREDLRRIRRAKKKEDRMAKNSDVDRLFAFAKGSAAGDIRDATIVGYGDPMTGQFEDVYLERTAPTGRERAGRAGIGAGIGAAAGGLAALAGRRRLGGRGIAALIGGGALGGGGIGAALNAPVREAYDPSTGAALPERIERQAAGIERHLDPSSATHNIAVGGGADLAGARGFRRGQEPAMAYGVDVDEMAYEDPELLSQFMGGPKMASVDPLVLLAQFERR